MKRKFSILIAALLLSSLTWAQITDVLDHDLIGVEGTTYTSWAEKTSNSDAVYAGNTAGGNNAIQMRSSNSNSGIVTTASGGVVTSIAVTWNENTAAGRTLNVYGSNSAYSAATDLYGNNAGELLGTIVYGTSTDLEISGEFAFIGIRSNNGALWLDQVSITWGEGSGVTPPSITASDVEIAYNATSGAIAFTVNNPVEGGVMTSTTEAEWLNLGTVGQNAPFTCSVNQTGAAREGIVTLTYTYGEYAIHKDVTVTQAGNPNALDLISDINATGTYAVQGTIVAKSQRGFIVGDGTGYVYYYNQNYDQDAYAIGDIVKLSGSVVTYGGVFEFNSQATVTAATSSNYVTEDPTVITGEEMDARVASTTPAELSSYVQYEGILTVSGNYYNITNINGAQTAKGSISYPIDTEFASLNGKQVKVTGYYVGVSSSQYYNTMLGTVEEVEITEASISVNPATVNASVEGAEGTLNVTYLGFTDGYNPEVTLCNAEGAAATYNWIEVDIDGNNNVEYIIDSNDGDARTAYLRVYVDDVYSNMVTINQDAYVTPALDYATLPFEFNSGKADIEGTDGLSEEGLGSDYNINNHPTTILKFDGSGDWLLLHFLEEPGALTFDIKGNSFSGGTFTVQTSEDGETYTDLVNYTELNATADTKIFDNLNENVRYIKWVYTSKSQGNVGLGNIHLYEAGGGPAVETYDLTIEPFENLEIFTFVDNELTEPLEGAGTIQVAAGDNVMLSVSANEGYVLESLMVDGVEHVNDIAEDLTYTFVMPNHNVTVSATAVEDIPFEPATYTLATSIESGKTYIIVGFHEGEAFAMGEQRNNNRKGVAISVDDNTATVETAEVHEFVITALEEDGFYSIFDEGYLYAASSNGNQLKTKDSLDVNGQWEISIDSVFSIVASNSENRNVMQFNYNNNNPAIFNCYAQPTQSPVYLFVKEETPTTTLQNIALQGGANWVSFNVEITLDDLKAALLDATGGQQALTIQSQTQNASYNANNHRWTGRLNTLDLSKMYKVSVASACEISLEGMPIDPTQLEITIENGVNWIAFPLNVNMTPANAFAGFALPGDKLQSQSNNAQFNGTRWTGRLTSMEPGKGYIYTSEQSATRTLVFPMGTR